MKSMLLQWTRFISIFFVTGGPYFIATTKSCHLEPSVRTLNQGKYIMTLQYFILPLSPMIITNEVERDRCGFWGKGRKVELRTVRGSVRATAVCM